jgi:toxin ParE1/3/4
VTPELIVRPEAEAEMGEAFDWYEKRVPGLGSDFLLNVDAALHSILRSPH